MSDDAGKGLRLYNTLTRQKDALRPLAVHPETGRPVVRMYVCGPTVYDYAHIGNARPAIVFDVLYRLLRHLHSKDHVVYARNITDVDDKINARAARDYPGLPLNEAIGKVTATTEAQYKADVRALGCLDPTQEPRATEHIEGMKLIIERLVARNIAYVAEGHVLFSPKAMDAAGGTLPRYGALARRSLDEMLAGARVDVAPYKRDPMDFVLWKPSEAGQPGWPSPAGIAGLGRPGWHIECSAMAMAKLLVPFGGGLACDDPEKNVFDIHGGGIDLVFPHHENEIAQSCCAFGTGRMAQIWMHNGFLQVEGEKMSKSLGNFFTINELMTTTRFGGRTWPGEVLRLAMLKTHYRQPIDFAVARLNESLTEISKFQRWYVESPAGYSVDFDPNEIEDGVFDALNDDLNTSEAISALHRAVSRLTERDAQKDPTHNRRLNAFSRALDVLGLQPREAEATVDPSVITSLIAARNAARTAKDWAGSDRIRDELAAMGIALKDSKDEAGNPVTTWEVKR